MPARDVVPVNDVEEQLGYAVVKIGVLRSQLIEVNLCVEVGALDGRPGSPAAVARIGVDVGVAEAIDVDEVELRERRKIPGVERDASPVVDEERRDELGGAGRGSDDLKRQAQAREQKRKGRC